MPAGTIGRQAVEATAKRAAQAAATEAATTRLGFGTAMRNLGGVMGGHASTWGPKVAQSAMTGAVYGAAGGGVLSALRGEGFFRGVGRGAIQGGMFGGMWGMGSAFATRTGTIGGGYAPRGFFNAGTQAIGNIGRGMQGLGPQSILRNHKPPGASGMRFHNAGVNITRNPKARTATQKAQFLSDWGKQRASVKAKAQS